MSAPAERLIRLLELLQSRRSWSGPELAQRLGVSTRTLRTNVAQLRELGYPVEATPGAAGGYELGAGSRMAPLLLDDDEAIAVAVGLRTTVWSGITGIEHASVRAHAKLAQVLPPGLGAKVEALQTTIEPLLWGTRTTSVSADALAVLSQACRDGIHVRFDYLDAAGVPSQRTVEPHSLVPDGGRWYLVAFDLDRNDWRTFRVDRADRARLARRRFRRRRLPAPDAATFVRERIVSSRPSHRVVVDFGDSLDEVTAAIGRPLAGLEGLPDGTTRLVTEVDHLDWFAMRLAMTGLDFKVREPDELRSLLRELAGRLARAAASGP